MWVFSDDHITSLSWPDTTSYQFWWWLSIFCKLSGCVLAGFNSSKPIKNRMGAVQIPWEIHTLLLSFCVTGFYILVTLRYLNCKTRMHNLRYPDFIIRIQCGYLIFFILSYLIIIIIFIGQSHLNSMGLEPMTLLSPPFLRGEEVSFELEFIGSHLNFSVYVVMRIFFFFFSVLLCILCCSHFKWPLSMFWHVNRLGLWWNGCAPVFLLFLAVLLCDWDVQVIPE